MDEVFQDLSILEVKGLKGSDYNLSFDDDLSYDSDLPEISYDDNYGDYDDRDYRKRRRRRADWEIHAEASEQEPPKKKKRKRKNKKHKKKPIDSVEPIPEFKNTSPLDPDYPPINVAELFPVGPSGIDDLHGNLIVNITWPFLQYEKPNECSDSTYEFLYSEGDERCVCDQMLQSDITPAAESAVCITTSDGDTDITVNSVCGKDKFDEPICFLNGCGDIISGRF